MKANALRVDVVKKKKKEERERTLGGSYSLINKFKICINRVLNKYFSYLSKRVENVSFTLLLS